jgi:uncharacterized protein
MRFILIIWLTAVAIKANAQSYIDSIVEFRKHYTEELLADKRSPITRPQVKNMNFYPPDPNYRVLATFTPTPGKSPFLVQTHSGKQKPFREYGYLDFMLSGNLFRLHMYQSVDLVNDMAHKDDLFIPFYDETNYQTTFPGGRYIDLNVRDIADNKVLLDFNKSYNPYCAYSDGYSCPIPPAENSLRTEIKAGEKMFLH